MPPAEVVGWGGGPAATVSLVRPAGLDSLRGALKTAASGAIARGMGRSYGDAAQLSGGLVVDTTAWKETRLDPRSGSITAGAGVTIGELLDALVPAGWMVPVVPGTQHVTVGGAIASDIHGKNHGMAGTFGSHVERISLLSSAGEVLELSPAEPLFQATLGGMGLTGVILSATIRLRAIQGPFLAVDTDKVASLDEALEALRAPGGPYRVAWLDLLAEHPGRGIVTRAEHVGEPSGPRSSRVRVRTNTQNGVGVRARARVPGRWPAGVLRPSTVRAFNALRYARVPARERGRIEGIARHMFPLDALDAWPRLYGASGFLQYQLVVPMSAEQVLETVIERLRRARVPCYLAVLKDFGPASEAPLSFPLKGWTLALDLPRAAPGVDALLDGFDQLVAEAGGRVYLTKDARMSRKALEAMYPRLDEWRAARDRADPRGLWRSDLALRVGLL
jgi:decaprenylphospho-beta-D-ribofuranose 2-oxidase